MARPSKYASSCVRAVRMVFEHAHEHPSQWVHIEVMEQTRQSH